MTEQLTQHFDEFARGATSAADFEATLVAICNDLPDSTWNVLALLDQYHRRRKLSAELYRTVRHRIQRHALGIEKLRTARIIPVAATAGTLGTDGAGADQVLPSAALPSHALPVRALPAVATPQPLAPRRKPLPGAPVLPFRHLLEMPADSSRAAADMPVPRQRRESRLRRGRTHALALAAIVCGVAASPSVKEIPVQRDTASQASPAQVPEQPSPGPEVVSLSSDQYVVHPRKNQAEILVQRGEQTAGAASFVWWTEGAGARPNEDFIAAAPRLTQMPDGVASVKLLVPILPNPARRHIELFYVMIGKLGGGARLGPVRRATVFIMPPD